MCLSDPINSGRETLLAFSRNALVGVELDDLLGERPVVLAQEALAELVDVQLRAVLRVVVKELKELLRLLVVLPLRGARRASSAACRFDGRMKTSKALRGVWSRRWSVRPAVAGLCGKG